MSLGKIKKSKNLLNVLMTVLCLLLIFGCKSSSNSDNSTKTTDDKSTKTSSKNPFVGEWTGKAFDGKTDLKMIFTDNEWTLISGSQNVMTRNYVLKGSDSVEIKTKEGTNLPMKITLNGDVLSAETDTGKTTLRRN